MNQSDVEICHQNNCIHRIYSCELWSFNQIFPISSNLTVARGNICAWLYYCECLFRLIRLNQLSYQIDNGKSLQLAVTYPQLVWKLTSLLEEAAIIGGDLVNISFNWTCGPFFHETFTGKINRGAPRMFSWGYLGGEASGVDIFVLVFAVCY